MEFNDFAQVEDLPHQLSEMSSRQRRSVEDYLTAYIDPIQNKFIRYMKEE